MRVRYSTKHTISLAIVFLLLLSLVPFQEAYASTVETRYFTSTAITYAGGSCRVLNATNSASSESVGLLSGTRIGIRVWKVNSSDAETEITSGSPVATAIYIDDGEYEVTWDCPETSLDSPDRIIVRVYMRKLTPATWYLQRTFLTEALGASKLDSATWTVHYELLKPSTTLNFWYGSSTYDSRITNFVWTPAVTTAWHDVSTWTANLIARTWSSGTIWSLTLLTSIWKDVATGEINLSTMMWRDISWLFSLTPPQWANVAVWTFSLLGDIDLISFALCFLALAFSIYPLVTGEEKALPALALVMAIVGCALSVLGLWYSLAVAALSFILSIAALATRKD